MDKSWIWLPNRLCREYKNGVRSFIDIAKNHLNCDNKSRCPCRDCQNTRLHDLATIQQHLILYGFSRSYGRWIFHGESTENDKNIEIEEIDDDKDDECIDLLNDVCGLTHGNEDMDHGGSSTSRNSGFHNFEALFGVAREELYPGCTKFSTLTFIVKLMHIKVLNHWSNKSFDMLLQLLKEALPKGSNIPDSHYTTKKMLRDIGLGYESIHACKYDCALFWKEHGKADKCPVCGEDRYKFDSGKNKKIPQKILRYFPLKPRLQRLFMSRHTAIDMRWHKDNCTNTLSILRHPADSEAWKDFDKQYPHFAMDPRNVRLGLATDGFNPFGNMSNSYSMWPVVLVPYNLPPWKCMKSSSFIMSLLIPGPQAPGKDIDVYLRPLIEELKELWKDGVETYDVSSGQTFCLHACILWTVNDFPAYGNLSGWSTKGYKACPVCNEETSSQPLRSKICYIGHRRYLSQNHHWRRSKQFNGKDEKRSPPKLLSGSDILEQLEHIRHVTFGKNPNNIARKRKRSVVELNWTKKSIFFELEYWSNLKIRHNLDVMHIEKNVCDNILGTLLNLEGKTKDTIKARMDLQDMNIRHELHLQAAGTKFLKPPACYTFTIDEKQNFCQFIKSVKFPDGYASNISRNVNVKEGKLSGLKSHDCHVLLQRILPIAIRPYLPKEVCTALVELSHFFQHICAKSLHVDDLDKLEKEIVLILCKLERIFPPAFFDIMVHLVLHLPLEAKVAGPVSFRWMYPFERYLGTLKKYVRNKARPEGSIAEAYIANEALTFCSMYLRGIETRFNRGERNDDGILNQSNGGLSVFFQKAKPFGAWQMKQLPSTELEKAHWYILNNCVELQPYLNDYTKELEKEGCSDISRRLEEQFPKWLKKKMTVLHNGGVIEATDQLYALACGPDQRVKSYNACIVNGVRFHSIDRDDRRITQNSGVVVPGEHNGDGIDFYGVLHAVLELDYLFGHHVILFKCEWFDTDAKKKRLQKDYHFICINVNKKWYMDDPFVLAIQAQQVFYVDDYKHGANWKVVQKIQHRHLWDIPVFDGTEEDTQSVDDVYQENELCGVQSTVEEILGSSYCIRPDANPEEVDNDIMNKERQSSKVELQVVLDLEDEDDTLIDYCTDIEESALNDSSSDDE